MPNNAPAIAPNSDRAEFEQQIARPYKIVTWKRSAFFPLQRLFNRMIFGDLTARLLHAADQGNTPAVLAWLRRGADIHAHGDLALRNAVDARHYNTASWLVHAGADHRVLTYQGTPVPSPS